MQRINKEKVIIIAEAGINHNGDLNTAYKLVEAAADAGADYVKFQTFKTELCISKDTPLAEYQKRDGIYSQYDLVKNLELSEEMHLKLISHCKKNNIKFLSTGFDLDSLDFLNTLGMDFFKIPSGEITNMPYLRKVLSFGKNIVLSTGMCNLDEIKSTLKVLEKSHITVLHCNTEYPTPMSDVNLRAMNTIASECNVPIGYSDHTLGIEVPIAAVAMGAKVIEKHFTINRNMEGPDHKSSLEPFELKSMVSSIRNIEVALGSTVKELTHSEAKNITIARKSIVASVKIKKGDIFTNDNISVKRPGDGLSPMLWDEVIGKISNYDFKMDSKIKL
ncbi:MAG: N-acetylneuraminate synthase [Legionella sp.]|nr:N-acetylneuraminate synthase [Legionella sp.]